LSIYLYQSYHWEILFFSLRIASWESEVPRRKWTLQWRKRVKQSRPQVSLRKFAIFWSNAFITAARSVNRHFNLETISLNSNFLIVLDFFLPLYFNRWNMGFSFYKFQIRNWKKDVIFIRVKFNNLFQNSHKGGGCFFCF